MKKKIKKKLRKIALDRVLKIIKDNLIPICGGLAVIIALIVFAVLKKRAKKKVKAKIKATVKAGIDNIRNKDDSPEDDEGENLSKNKV